jgi:hypothetical protein
VALPARNHDEPSLAFLIECSAELKRALVGFALSPRFERQMERFVLESGSDENRIGSPVRKIWGTSHEPRPDISVLGARLSELLRQ